MAVLDEKRLRERHREAAVMLSGVDVPFDAFAEAALAALEDDATTIDDLHVKDLYLALACLQKDASAIARLEQDFLRPIRPSVERACRNGTTSVEDVMQWTLEKLLVSEGNKSAPKLAQYTGRGPLLGWLRVIAVREALQDRRKSKRERLRDDAAMLDGGETGVEMELALLRERYGTSFRESVQAAIRCLTAEQRTLLRFYTRDGLTIDQLAPILGVHRATAARRLEKARADALAFTRRILREKHGLSESEARSLCIALAAQVDVSIGRALSDEALT